MSYNHHQHYGHPQAGVPIYAEHGEYADIDEPAVAESRPEIFPASHPLFTREEISNTRALDPYPSTQSPHSWAPYEPPFHQQPLSYAPYPSPSPFPPPRLSPPPTSQTFHFKAPGQSISSSSASHRLTLAGSLDPATGIFYRTPEHPRLRTAQACEKCRTRKAKCSGEHPSCKRCINRGLICEYAKEGRVRGPNKPKPKTSAASTASPSASTSSTSTGTSGAGNNETTPTSTKSGDYDKRTGPHRPPSSHSSGGSSDQTPNEASGQSLFLPSAAEVGNVQSSGSGYLHHRSPPDSPLSSSPSFSRGRSSVMEPMPSTSTSRQNSSGEHRSHRSRLIDAHIESASSLFRLSGSAIGDESGQRLGSSDRIDVRISDMGPGMGVRSLPEDTHFYPYQQQPQLQNQQRTVHEHGYLPETFASRSAQQHPQRYQHPDQPYQHFHPQRELVSIQEQQQYGSLYRPGGEMHALNPVNIAQSRRVVSSMRTGTAQAHQSFPPQGHPPSQQQFGGHQPQQHSLVPIQLGLNIPGGPGDHRSARRQHELSEELTYPHPSPGGISFFQAQGHQAQERPGRAPESSPHEHQSEYHLHDPYRHHEAQQHQQQQHQQQSLLHQHVTQIPVAQMNFSGHGPQADYLVERRPYEEPAYTSPRTASATSTSSSTLGSGSPMTPLSALASAGEMLLYHYAAAPSRLDPELHEMQPSGSATSLTSASSLHGQPSHRQRPPEGGGELHAGHSVVGGEGEIMLGGSAAVQQRGNGHAHGALSVNGNLTSFASHQTENGHSLGAHGYGNENVSEVARDSLQLGHRNIEEDMKLC